ncbi:hypothetical protein KPATCC21470_1186 [Kitasatospora purpeofusca]
MSSKSRIFILKHGQLIGDLCRLGRSRGRDDQTLRPERARPASEQFDRGAQVACGEPPIVLALNDRVVAVGLSPRKVDSVLRLTLHPVPAELDTAKTANTAHNREQ